MTVQVKDDTGKSDQNGGPADELVDESVSGSV
jgi:hypothetical protein